MTSDLPTPALLVDLDRLRANIDRMQRACRAGGVELWPHAKTHKCVEIARMQMEAGAAGLCCAKLSEAEALLPCGVRRLFVAHSLADPGLAPRLRALADRLDELIVACTSEAHFPALEALLRVAGLRLPVLMAVDTGLGREGVRDRAAARRLAARITACPTMRLHGLYTHEGHAYTSPERPEACAAEALRAASAVRDALDPALPLWPGCSVTAEAMAQIEGVHAVRPGTYVFGDLSLARTRPVMPWSSLALSVLATVVDRPEPGLAIVDAGSKCFSSDRTPDGLAAADLDRRDLLVRRLSEEHGFVTGADADGLNVGDRLRLVPAHVCPAVNLADHLTVVSGDAVVASWSVAARGCVW
ncbi:MAG: alanine racemase [Armatimonadetes bacterium]|nr:alanine racemase [Armatimonadota bacterium]